MKKRMDLSQVLSENKVEVSAPCRVDVSGTWDLPQLALPYHHVEPATTNIALDLRIKCTLKPCEAGKVRVSDETFSETHRTDKMNFNSNFGLIFSIVSHFNVEGVEIHFEYGFPPKSGLGGSGVLAVSTIAALSKARSLIDPEFQAMNPKEIATLAHRLENGLRFSYTGCQDQCAAAFGGVNTWKWKYGDQEFFTKETVIENGQQQGLQDRLMVAYTGMAHNSSDVNELQVRGFFDSSTRHHWLRINEIAFEFAEAIKTNEWSKAADLIFEEHEMRCNLVPRRKTSTAQKLEDSARKLGAGFAVSGAGNGGCVWALCQTPEQKEELTKLWEQDLKHVPDGKILPVSIPSQGIIYNEVT